MPSNLLSNSVFGDLLKLAFVYTEILENWRMQKLCAHLMAVLFVSCGFAFGQDFQIVEGNFTWFEAKADAEAKGGR
ncbi:MAG: hypothetical protein ACKVKH_18825, partial [Verrucomicrobiales bacterium]